MDGNRGNIDKKIQLNTHFRNIAKEYAHNAIQQDLPLHRHNSPILPTIST